MSIKVEFDHVDYNIPDMLHSGIMVRGKFKNVPLLTSELNTAVVVIKGDDRLLSDMHVEAMKTIINEIRIRRM